MPTLKKRLGDLRELEARRAAVLESIAAQGELTPELKAAIVMPHRLPGLRFR